MQWLKYHSGDDRSFVSWSFSEGKPYLWMTKKEFKSKMKEIRTRKLEEFKEMRESCQDPSRLKWINRCIGRLMELLKICT